jgi:hypothetical protein
MEEAVSNWEGRELRQCNDHRTVGSHRAWCHDCHEWCYPRMPCRGCELPAMESLIRRLWEAQHVVAFDYQVASIEDFTSPVYFGTEESHRALTKDEAITLRSTLEGS